VVKNSGDVEAQVPRFDEMMRSRERWWAASLPMEADCTKLERSAGESLTVVVGVEAVECEDEEAARWGGRGDFGRGAAA